MSEFPELEFMDEPPPSNRGNDRLYHWFANQLKANPGKWAKLPLPNKAGISTNIARGRMPAFRPAGHFECVYRAEIDSTDKWNFVRYIGPVEEPKADESTTRPIDLQRERNPDRAARIDAMIGKGP
jgi:hypothetical protein